MSKKYTKLVLDVTTGEKRAVEISENDMWRDKLGLHDATDAEIEAARIKWQAAQTAETARVLEMEMMRDAFADALDAYPVLEIDALIQQVEDTSARAALNEINALVNTLRAILALQ